MSTLTDMIMRHEGPGPKLPNGHYGLYQDTVGKWTGPWGHNYSDNGISPTVAAFQLDDDIAAIQGDLRRTFPWFTTLDPVRQDVVVDMAFNLGLPRFSKFEHMLAALERQDWETAANEMLASNWSKEVGARATELAAMMRSGQYQI